MKAGEVIAKANVFLALSRDNSVAESERKSAYRTAREYLSKLDAMGVEYFYSMRSATYVIDYSAMRTITA